MAYVHNPVNWVGIAVRMDDGTVMTYELHASHLINVEIERSVDPIPDWGASMEAGYMIHRPSDYERVDIRVSGIASRWRDYPHRDNGPAEQIEPARKAIDPTPPKDAD